MSIEIARHWRLKAQRYQLVGDICPKCHGKMFPPRDVCPDCADKERQHTHNLKVIGSKE